MPLVCTSVSKKVLHRRSTLLLLVLVRGPHHRLVHLPDVPLDVVHPVGDVGDGGDVGAGGVVSRLQAVGTDYEPAAATVLDLLAGCNKNKGLGNALGQFACFCSYLRSLRPLPGSPPGTSPASAPWTTGAPARPSWRGRPGREPSLCTQADPEKQFLNRYINNHSDREFLVLVLFY